MSILVSFSAFSFYKLSNLFVEDKLYSEITLGEISPEVNSVSIQQGQKGNPQPAPRSSKKPAGMIITVEASKTGTDTSRSYETFTYSEVASLLWNWKSKKASITRQALTNRVRILRKINPDWGSGSGCITAYQKWFLLEVDRLCYQKAKRPDTKQIARWVQLNFTYFSMERFYEQKATS